MDLRRRHPLSLAEPFLVFFLILPTALSDFSPATNILLNCGADANATEEDRSFLPDSSNSNHFRLLGRGSSLPRTDSVVATANNTPSGISHTARVFTAETTYEFTAQSTGTHFLRLHFFPFTAANVKDGPYNLSDATFQVNVLDKFVLLANFSATGAPLPIVKEYLLFIPDKNKIKLTFIPVDVGNSVAFVNAVELFTAPKDLIDRRKIESVNLTKTVMETVYRINVGGDLLTPINDTVWRTWINDREFLLSPNLAENNRTSKINYPSDGIPPTPEFAPSPVYSTLEHMNLVQEGSRTNNFNITWNFSVSSGYKHFIRMHFCDFVSPSVNELKFNVYLNRKMKEQDLQPGEKTRSTYAQPFYIDFVVDAQKEKDASVLVSIGKSEAMANKNGDAFLNGLEIMKLNDSRGSLVSGFRVGNSGGQSGGTSAIVKVVVSVVAVCLLLFILLIGAFLFILRKRKYKHVQMLKEEEGEDGGGGSGETGHSAAIANGSSTASKLNFRLKISLEELKLATDEFDENRVIGSGGFGKVYKGELRRDGTVVAVKRGLNSSKQGLPEFQNEIMLLSQIRHRHLVSLVGFCDESDQMILVYEYMENGTLKSHLYGNHREHTNNGFRPLSWKQRLGICISAAKGLHYLHTGYSPGIIHRDVKTSNILLTGDEGGEENSYLAKVSDFGLSKIGPDVGETHVSTMVKGSFGYIDPEYFKTQKLTEKSDVYSFGVVLLEILCGRPAVDISKTSREEINLAEYGVGMHKRGELESIVDRSLVGTINANSLRKFGETAVRCLSEKGCDRPEMAEVMWNLEYMLQLHEMESRREMGEDSVVTDVCVSSLAPRNYSRIGGNSDTTVDVTNFSQPMRSDGSDEDVLFSH